MATTTSDVLVDTLINWGVDTVFGIPGDGINGVIEALRQKQDKIRFIQVRHEESAAFMACAYSKYTGKLGVCIATSGPGGIHLLNGLYDAKMDGQSVLSITGQHFHDLIDTHSQQDIDLDKLFMDVAVYNVRVMGPQHMETVADLACRAAIVKRGVAHMTIPIDFQSATVTRKHSMHNVLHHTSDIRAKGANLPREADLQQAAEVLNAGKKIVILAGRGALRAGDELEQLAEKLGAPIDRQSHAGESSRSRSQSLHHRRNWSDRNQALPGRNGRMRHAVDGGHFLPLHGVFAQAGTGTGGTD